VRGANSARLFQMAGAALPPFPLLKYEEFENG
jgi:hypothetical protein